MADPGKLSKRARTAIEVEDVLLVSAISCWEVAMLVAKGRLQLDRDVLVWISQALAHECTDLAPITPEIAVRAARLDGSFPGDPADRLIVATALVNGASLATKDGDLRKLAMIDVVW